jgi:hypothetical protein
MPDLSQVLTTVTLLVQEAVYPNGTSQPSVAGVQVSIEEGWPIRSNLDKDLAAGYAHVSVFPTNKERVVTKFERTFQPNTLTPATLTAVVSGQTITIGGTVSIPQAVMVIVNGQAAQGYGYQVLITDTLDSIAAGIAALIPGASAVGAVVTVPSAFDLVARIATQYTASEELSRQERVFMISVWSPTPEIRYLLGSAIDVTFKENYRIVLSDNYFGQVFYDHVEEIDMLEQEIIYRRDLFYNVQYPTTVTNSYTTITDPYTNLEVVGGVT